MTFLFSGAFPKGSKMKGSFVLMVAAVRQQRVDANPHKGEKEGVMHMKQKLGHGRMELSLTLMIGICSGCCSSKVETSTLGDTLIAIKDQARIAGAKTVKYEASVVTSAEGKIALVVPVVTSPSIGFTGKREIGTKVTVELDLGTKEGIRTQASGKKYLLDLKTLSAEEMK